ncbi:3-hydroxyacyl-CoA dehydrogenase NAD-binding domain-containing protein [Amycolatopsis minnesotensis]|uniref:3-hydroxyacyl-CoA dehydrogenase NAD-binding domain-containing protein n=1 Tax=Amycolatopsis minnesotensis TaxID=337894 RepID=UPI0031D42357
MKMNSASACRRCGIDAFLAEETCWANRPGTTPPPWSAGARRAWGSIPIDEVAGYVPEPGRLIGTHFMNPPCPIPAVEVIRGVRTSTGAVLRADASLIPALLRPREAPQ